MAEFREGQRPSSRQTRYRRSASIRACLPCQTWLAGHLLVRILVVASHVGTVDLLGEAQLFMRARIRREAFSALKLALWRIIAVVASHNSVGVRAVHATGADVLHCVTQG